jgi:hypothetical protein
MKVSMKLISVSFLIAGMSLAANSATAGCAPDGLNDSYIKPAVYWNDDAGGMIRTHYDSYGPFNTSDITGLWKFVFTAYGNTGKNAPLNAVPLPDDAVVDAGFVTWHDDGTELMNSGRAPATGSFCMGVWKQIGRDSYRLNHWALSWIPDYHPGQTQSWSEVPGGLDETFKAFGPTNIQEVISLSNHGDSYTGTFKLTQYVNDGSSKPINDTSGAPVAFVILGKITATRINP